jgi:hypothetical protein
VILLGFAFLQRLSKVYGLGADRILRGGIGQAGSREYSAGVAFGVTLPFNCVPVRLGD